MPREAISSTGRQPSKWAAFSKSCGAKISADSSAATKVSYSVLIHRRVEVVGRGAFAVARFPVELRQVERVGGQNRRDGVVEVQTVAAEEVVDRVEERLGRERAGGDDEEVVAVAVERRYLVASQRDVRLVRDGARDRDREALAVDGEGITGRDASVCAAADDERVEQRHLRLEQADRIGDGGGAEGVRANELGEVRCLMRRGRLRRAHLEEIDLMAAPCQAERAFRTGQAGTDDFDACH